MAYTVKVASNVFMQTSKADTIGALRLINVSSVYMVRIFMKWALKPNYKSNMIVLLEQMKPGPDMNFKVATFKVTRAQLYFFYKLF